MIKKVLSLVSILPLIFVFYTPNACAQTDLGLSAKAAVIIDADSGRIIYSENENSKLSMASTTKIMTSLLAIENCQLDVPFCVNSDMVTVEGTSMGLISGDTVTMRAIVYGMLLQSGNDAANVAAYIIAGNIKNFADLMNKRAEQIGMSNTNFVTPSGLDDDEHYSTAYDMALLGAQAIKNPLFCEICSQKSKRVAYGNPPYERTLTNHNKFLSMYEGAFGIKTGFTKKSGRCLVTAVKKDDITLVAVTLNAPDDWNDHVKLYDYAFSKVKSYELDTTLTNMRFNVVGANSETVEIEASSVPRATLFDGELQTVKKTVLMKKFEYAPVEKGTVIGEIRYSLDGVLLCQAPITVCDEIECVTTPGTESNSFIYKFFESIISFIKDLFS